MGDEHINNVVTDSIKKFLELEQWKVEVDQKLKSLGTELQNVRQVNTELKSENQKFMVENKNLMKVLDILKLNFSRGKIVLIPVTVLLYMQNHHCKI